jgi:uncharacterized protein
MVIRDKEKMQRREELGLGQVKFPLSSSSLETLWELNEANAEATSSFSLDEFQNHLSLSSAVFTDARLNSLMIIFQMNVNYNSVNYQWLKFHGFEGGYIDRVMVDHKAKNQGLGRELYCMARDWAKANGLDRLLCEVNLIPANPVSLKFHKAIGFELIEDVIHPIMTDQGPKTVRFLQWEF